MEIKLLKGINQFEFGLNKGTFLQQNPNNSQFEIIEEDDELKTESIFINEIKSSLYFEGGETEMIFTSCETENNEALLYGVKVFDKTEKEIIHLMKDYKFTDLEEEDEEWGEKRISFYDAMADFYFSQGKLVSVYWGILLL